MTRPDPKQVKAMTEIAGVPQDSEVAARIANSIGPAFDGFAPVSGTLPMDLEPASFSAGAAREGVDMSGEPALMSLVAVAKAIAGEEIFLARGHAVLSRPDRAMAAARQRLHGDRGGGGARRR